MLNKQENTLKVILENSSRYENYHQGGRILDQGGRILDQGSILDQSGTI